MRKRSKLFAAVAFVAFVYVALRAIFVPVSHDEAVTYFLYVQSGAFLPHNMIWDANNHILNSALMYPLYKLFGADLFWLRMPNVAAFPVYAFFIFRLVSGLRSSAVFFLGISALLSAPLLLDFFAQARGYGLSMAGFAGALYFMSRYFSTRLSKYQWFVWLCFVCTLTANMSMINSYLIALGLIAAMMLRMFGFSNLKTHLLPYAIGGLLPFAGFSIYAAAMRQRGLLYYGNKDGFVETTVRLINKFVLYSDNLLLARAVAFLGAFFGGYLLLKWLVRRLHGTDTGTVSAVFLLANAAGAILLRYLLEVNYPEDRTGLYFVPLFILVATFFFDDLVCKVPRLKYAALSLAVFPALAIAGGNIGYTRLWRDLHLHPGLYDFVADRHPDGDVTVESYFLTASSWSLRAVSRDTKLAPIIPARNARGRADYAICHDFRCDPYAATHDTVHRDPRNNTYLMQRRTPVEWHLLKESDALPLYEGDAELFEFFTIEDEAVLSRLGAVDLTLRPESDASPLVCDIIISATDEKGKKIFHDFLAINWIREEWQGDTLTLRRAVNLPEGSRKLVCYVWNIRKAEVSIAFDKITLLEAAGE